MIGRGLMSRDLTAGSSRNASPTSQPPPLARFSPTPRNSTIAMPFGTSSLFASLSLCADLFVAYFDTHEESHPTNSLLGHHVVLLPTTALNKIVATLLLATRVCLCNRDRTSYHYLLFLTNTEQKNLKYSFENTFFYQIFIPETTESRFLFSHYLYYCLISIHYFFFSAFPFLISLFFTLAQESHLLTQDRPYFCAAALTSLTTNFYKLPAPTQDYIQRKNQNRQAAYS